jgi:iron complex outermembrane recepter protein
MRVLPLVYVLGLGALAPAALGQATGTIRGTVLLPGGAPAPDAQVQILDLRRKAAAAEDGRFVFQDVPPGEYLLEARSRRFGLHVTRVSVEAGREAEVEMTIDLAVHQEEVVVSAHADPHQADELAQPVTVLGGEDLALNLAPSLGETLARQPGVSSTYFGPGASRPVIRGLGGDRIRVLQSGLGSADASNTSPDHAVSFDPLSARQIEVLRGPATLLYGSSAVGGVVNILDNRIPDALPDHKLGGSLDLAGGTAGDERSAAASVQGAAGMVAFHGDFLKRATDDIHIPGFAESAALRREEAEEGGEHEQAAGVLENSATESQGGSLGGSVIGGSGFVGVSLSGLDTLYGVPGGHTPHEAEPGGEAGEDQEGIEIDLRQRRGDLRGEWNRPLGALRAVRARFGIADYEHRELEGGAVGTVFSNESWEGRLDLLHRPAGPLTGSLGLQVGRRDFTAVGEEAFIPPTRTTTLAAFAFEEIGRGPLKLQLGARVESQDVEARGAAPATRSLTGWSGSAGFTWQQDGWSLALTAARSTKLPTAEELFSNGPHLATRAFEVGNPDLRKEKSLGLDLALRRRAGRLTGEVSVFTNRFDDYIYESFTGAEEDGLAVAEFVQGDARFWGGEAEATFDVLHREPHHLDLELSADLVRAELRPDGQPLPRIPPSRLAAGLHYHNQRWSARAEARRASEQDRVGPFERPTEGYTFVNVSAGYRFFAGRTVCDLLLKGTNLTDAEGRNHVSFLKDLAPLPGRDLRLSVRLLF